MTPNVKDIIAGCRPVIKNHSNGVRPFIPLGKRTDEQTLSAIPFLDCSRTRADKMARISMTVGRQLRKDGLQIVHSPLAPYNTRSARLVSAIVSWT